MPRIIIEGDKNKRQGVVGFPLEKPIVVYAIDDSGNPLEFILIHCDYGLPKKSRPRKLDDIEFDERQQNLTDELGCATFYPVVQRNERTLVIVYAEFEIKGEIKFSSPEAIWIFTEDKQAEITAAKQRIEHEDTGDSDEFPEVKDDVPPQEAIGPVQPIVGATLEDEPSDEVEKAREDILQETQVFSEDADEEIVEDEDTLDSVYDDDSIDGEEWVPGYGNESLDQPVQVVTVDPAATAASIPRQEERETEDQETREGTIQYPTEDPDDNPQTEEGVMTDNTEDPPRQPEEDAELAGEEPKTDRPAQFDALLHEEIDRPTGDEGTVDTPAEPEPELNDAARGPLTVEQTQPTVPEDLPGLTHELIPADEAGTAGQTVEINDQPPPAEEVAETTPAEEAFVRIFNEEIGVEGNDDQPEPEEVPALGDPPAIPPAETIAVGQPEPAVADEVVEELDEEPAWTAPDDPEAEDDEEAEEADEDNELVAPGEDDETRFFHETMFMDPARKSRLIGSTIVLTILALGILVLIFYGIIGSQFKRENKRLAVIDTFVLKDIDRQTPVTPVTTSDSTTTSEDALASDLSERQEDGDGDGYCVYADQCLSIELIPGDCNDFLYMVNPGQTEHCSDLLDNDCDKLTDGSDPDCSIPNEGDGFAAETPCPDCPDKECPEQTCPPPPACADPDCPDCNCPKAVCPEHDCPEPDCPECAVADCPEQECPEQTCPACPPLPEPEIIVERVEVFPEDDADADGYCRYADECLAPHLAAGDCDDENVTIYPGAGEDCHDGIDNDCDGLVDSSDDECQFESSLAPVVQPVENPTPEKVETVTETEPINHGSLRCDLWDQQGDYWGLFTACQGFDQNRVFKCYFFRDSSVQGGISILNCKDQQ